MLSFMMNSIILYSTIPKFHCRSFYFESHFCSYPNIVWYNSGRSFARTGYLDVATIAEFIEVSSKSLLLV